MRILEINTLEHSTAAFRTWHELRSSRLGALLPPMRVQTFEIFAQSIPKQAEANFRWRVWLADPGAEGGATGYAELSLLPRDNGHSYACVYVRPELRRRGIGSALLETVSAAAREESRSRIGGPSYGMPTDPAVPFFARLGLSPILKGHFLGASMADLLTRIGEDPRRLSRFRAAGLQKRLNREDFFDAVARKVRVAGRASEAWFADPNYEHYLAHLAEEEENGERLHDQYWLFLRDAVTACPIAAVGAITGSFPTAFLGGHIFEGEPDAETAHALVIALISKLSQTLPGIETVLVSAQNSPFQEACVRLGFARGAEMHSWRLDL